MSGLRAMMRDFAYEHVGGAALVLIYHRVADVKRDPQLLAVTPENFDAQMRLLSERYEVLPLSDLLGLLRKRRVPDRAVVVTFDDGYADNLLNAMPILAEHAVPATIFVSSGYAGGEREFWPDEIERLVLEPGRLPEHFEIAVRGSHFMARLQDSAEYSEEDADRDRGWNVLEPATNGRQRLYVDLCDFVRPLDPDSREQALGQLRATANAEPEVRESHRPLSPEEVAALDAAPLVEIGSHTLDHTQLSALPAAEQREQITQDRRRLGEWCGRPMDVFSYPYGGLSDYTDETVAMVRESGFQGACANHIGVTKPWTDPFRIPRNLVRDWTEDVLAARIDAWFRGDFTAQGGR